MWWAHDQPKGPVERGRSPHRAASSAGANKSTVAAGGRLKSVAPDGVLIYDLTEQDFRSSRHEMLDRPFYQLIFCPSLRILYAPIPKAACTSFKAYLRDEMGLPPLQDIHRNHDRRYNGFSYADQIDRERLASILLGKGKKYFKFVVGRNPYTRLVSAYHDLVAPPRNEGPRGRPLRQAVTLRCCEAFDKRPSEILEISFETFIEMIGRTDKLTFDRHWQEQTTLCCAQLVAYDLTLRVEDVERRGKELADKSGLKKPIQLRLNASNDDERECRSLFTPEMQKIVQTVYARDFKRFRYDPDDIPLFAAPRSHPSDADPAK